MQPDGATVDKEAVKAELAGIYMSFAVQAANIFPNRAVRAAEVGSAAAGRGIFEGLRANPWQLRFEGSERCSAKLAIQAQRIRHSCLAASTNLHTRQTR